GPAGSQLRAACRPRPRRRRRRAGSPPAPGRLRAASPAAPRRWPHLPRRSRRAPRPHGEPSSCRRDSGPGAAPRPAPPGSWPRRHSSRRAPSCALATIKTVERLLVLGAGAGQLGLPHPISPQTAVLSASKLRQRERLAEAGIPQTRWQVVSRADEAVQVPCLVRPPDRQGRRARALVRSSRELRGAVRAALRASRIGLCLVEELAEQPVVTVTAFSRDGGFHPLVVTDRAPLAHVWESEHADLAAALAGRAAEAL